jgi:hypothetical protein
MTLPPWPGLSMGGEAATKLGLKESPKGADEMRVRATRAYLAGLGTAGTLVLAASMLFILGSAMVAFNGWPKLDGANSPATQFLTAHSSAGASGHRRGTAGVPVAAVTVVSGAQQVALALRDARAFNGTAAGGSTPGSAGKNGTGRLSSPGSRTGSLSTDPGSRTTTPTSGGTPTKTTTPTSTTTGSGSSSGSGSGNGSGTGSGSSGGGNGGSTGTKSGNPTTTTKPVSPGSPVTQPVSTGVAQAATSGGSTATTVSKVTGTISKPATNI